MTPTERALELGMAAFEDAALQGLCPEGAWEVAVSAMRAAYPHAAAETGVAERLWFLVRPAGVRAPGAGAHDPAVPAPGGPPIGPTAPCPPRQT